MRSYPYRGTSLSTSALFKLGHSSWIKKKSGIQKFVGYRIGKQAFLATGQNIARAPDRKGPLEPKWHKDSIYFITPEMRFEDAFWSCHLSGRLIVCCTYERSFASTEKKKLLYNEIAQGDFLAKVKYQRSGRVKGLRSLCWLPTVIRVQGFSTPRLFIAMGSRNLRVDWIRTAGTMAREIGTSIVLS